MTTDARTLAWLGVLIVGIAATAYFVGAPSDNHSKEAAHGETGDGDHRLVPIPIDDLSGIAIVLRGESRHFLRDPEGRWLLHSQDHGHQAGTAGEEGGAHAHKTDPERSREIAKAFAMFGHARIERVVGTGQAGERFGTVNPEMIIALYRSGEAQPFRRILVGDVAPDSLARYVLLQERLETVTIPNYQVANLEDLLADLEGP